MARSSAVVVRIVLCTITLPALPAGNAPTVTDLAPAPTLLDRPVVSSKIAQAPSVAQPSTVSWRLIALRVTVKMSQTAINIAAIMGPMTKPLRPAMEMPPSVEISTR